MAFTAFRFTSSSSASLGCPVDFGPADAQQAKFSVESTSYKDSETIPKKYAGAAANCGSDEKVSPYVAWKNLPEGTKSVAVFLVDPDGQKGLGTSHLVAYNIPADPFPQTSTA